ncbi:MAG: hypothetical protein ACE5F9_07950 [Phycisphaerae bacterium]
MAKTRVLDVGNCDPDHGMIRSMLLQHFDVDVDRVMSVDEALASMRERSYALVLFNRLIFSDGSEGIELLRRAKADPMLSGIPIMMISNLAEAQAASLEARGEPGFGKQAIGAPATLEAISPYLPRK